jgi:urea carboxylase
MTSPTTPPPFGRVLVANRGEIACRVIATLRRLGIESVAVYADPDRASAHVTQADAAVALGGETAADSYLRIDRVVQAAVGAGAHAVHPGYGFLSESAAFAAAVEDAGLTFLGPTPDQIAAFGDKDRARTLARAAGVPLLPGTGVIAHLEAAAAEAEAIGYPVLLKATAGGGGIGMARCDGPDELADAWARVTRTGQASFGSSALFIERFLPVARHVEVQVVGDGRGGVAVLGDRDCSVQRRNQKVVEEAPAPALSPALRVALAESARRLAASVGYRSVGTVEFLVDPARQEHHFLEVNARLQVEHGVTELVTGLDLVEVMVDVAATGTIPADATPVGHAVEARIYAEDPAQGFRPSAGLLTAVHFPAGVRVDTWVDAGTEVTPLYDPLLAKVLVRADDRAGAVAALADALDRTRLAGVETNRQWVRAALADPAFVAAAHGTATVEHMPFTAPTIDVLASPGAVTVQDWPGRVGYWAVGVPPSGPMDDLSFRLGNRVVGNPEGTAGLECEVHGPTLRFNRPALVCVAGAEMGATVDGARVEPWAPVAVTAGSTLACGPVAGPGARGYLLLRGGVDVPEHLGSRATFTLGGFGGHGGRALRPGDVLRLDDPAAGDGAPAALPVDERPALTTAWEVGVLDGPHADPDFLTAEGIAELYAMDWQVHYNSARTGVRLVGPKPQWARTDGGEAGLHPSNIHDTPYGLGAIDLTGDMPVILGPDGPSLGGFVCPLTVAAAERWKVGQLRAGDTIRFRSLTPTHTPAPALSPAPPTRARGNGFRKSEVEALSSGSGTYDLGLGKSEPIASEPIASGSARDPGAGAPGTTTGPAGPGRGRPSTGAGSPSGAVLHRRPADGDRPAATYRRSGDRYVLVEYGEPVLDIDLRVRVHLLMERLTAAAVPGVIDITPGIRSLQVHVDGSRLTVDGALAVLRELDDDLPPVDGVRIASRVVHMPLSWDDPATREAIERYVRVVRDDAPWCPSNLEFIRRVNGLDDIDAVHSVVFDARYLVLGLGDVYLGAPVATPLDPRHRLVTTKYNPARTWTPENAVGIGGAYLCIYGMEGPGGYQFVGRTVPVWSRHRPFRQTTAERPWLLRFFDQIRFHPVSAEELGDLRADMVAGRGEVRVTETVFDAAEHRRFLAAEATGIAAFRAHQRAAFAEERQRWHDSGELDRVARLAETEAGAGAATPGADGGDGPPPPPGATLVTAPFAAKVGQVEVREGDTVAAGARVAVLEAMKMEVSVPTESDGVVTWVGCRPGQLVAAGQPLAGVEPGG